MLEKVVDQINANPSEDPADDLRRLRAAFGKHSGRMPAGQLEKFTAAAMALMPKVALIERMAFAKQLSESLHTPRTLLNQILGDHYMVSAPVLENSPVLDESDLITAMEQKGAAVKAFIVKRRELSLTVTDRLLDGADRKLQCALAANRGARISKKNFAVLVDAAAGDEDMTAALLGRRDVPQALTAQLKQAKGPGRPTSAPANDAQPAAAPARTARPAPSSDEAAPKSKLAPAVKVFRY